jgi:hypothetical protein
MEDSPYQRQYDALQKRWPYCNQHKGYCYITKGGSFDGVHYDLEPREWGMWATAITNGKAIIDYPPRTEEFDQILESNCIKNSKGKRGKKAITMIETSNDPLTRIPNITVNVAPPATSVRRHSDPISPQKVRKSASPSPTPEPMGRKVLELLSARGYSPADYSTSALKDFLKYLKEMELAEEDYDNVYECMRAHKVGVDLFDNLNPVTLAHECQIAFGTAVRVIGYFQDWLIS